jgi:ubiquinone biosynthesis protein COQ4
MTPRKRKLEWQRAWKALQGLIADSSRTELAFEITEALAGNSFERSFQKFRAHQEGQRLLLERPSLLATLSNRDTLAAMPRGSFGRAYADFMTAGQLSTDGLVEAQAMAFGATNADAVDADREYFGNRVRDMHDLWHVLTGYGMDEAGEAANLAFNLGQIWNLGIALMVLAAAIIGPKDLTCTWPRYLFRAWRRGRRAAVLTVVPYERLLPLPVDDVRIRLQIEPADIAHPMGILVGNRSYDGGDWRLKPVGCHSGTAPRAVQEINLCGGAASRLSGVRLQASGTPRA